MSSDDDEIPLGQRESETLEFKAKDILKTPTKIGREVVGFLNASGGQIWIGLREQDGMSVPPAEDIPGAQGAADALRDHLIATIEPALQDEIALDLIPIPGGGNLIRVTVETGTRGPYAQLDRGRHFLIRVTDRLREMSRQEIEERIGREIEERIRKGGRADSDRAAVSSELRAAQAKAMLEKPSRLWICLQPIEPLDLDFADEAVKKRFGGWLSDPRTTNNRPGGANFVIRHLEPRPFHDRTEIGDRTIPYFTEVTGAGRITFVKAEGLFPVFALAEKDVVVPWLLEYPVSLFRFMAQILTTYRPNHTLEVGATMAVSGLRGVRLIPGSPSNHFPPPWQQPKVLESDVVELDPIIFRSGDIVNAPDRCGMQLVRRVYYAFGFDDHAIPSEYDPKTGVLLLG